MSNEINPVNNNKGPATLHIRTITKIPIVTKKAPGNHLGKPTENEGEDLQEKYARIDGGRFAR